MILTDLNLPDGSGIDLIREASKSKTESMVITVFDDEAHVVDAHHDATPDKKEMVHPVAARAIPLDPWNN